jgi:hypothetical protein
MSGADEVPLTQRDIENLRVTLDKLDRTITALPDKVAEIYVRKDVAEPRFTAIERDVEKHDAWLTWTQRIVIGAVILALLGLVVSGH